MTQPITVHHWPPARRVPDSVKLIGLVALGVWLGQLAALATWWFIVLEWIVP